MVDPMIEDAGEVTTPIKELSKPARRVLGVLLEKAFTVPESYPLTLKAVTTGCNQKNNRSPLTNYSEDDVYDTLEKLRDLGLVAVVHTESGRTERYRHYMRKRFTLSEAQLAILTELLLRGRQQVGELRSRAARMVPIDTLEQLREELDGLVALNLLQSTGSLDRRGVEVDHNLYSAHEGMKLSHSIGSDEPTQVASPAPSTPIPRVTPERPPAMQPSPAAQAIDNSAARLTSLESGVAHLKQENLELRNSIEGLKGQLAELAAQFEDLRLSLGG